MKKIIITLILLLITTSNAFAAKLPDNITNLIKKSYPKTDFRFDGLITLPDGTIYLPLYPALVKKPDTTEIKMTVPSGQTLAQEPDIVIFNNDFTLVKVITDTKNRKTVLYMKTPPIEVRTGLLPQDMLVPTGLIIPDNIKGIIGNLQIPTAQDAGLKVQPETFTNAKPKPQTTKNITTNSVKFIPELKNKTMYIATCYSKNIQVVSGESAKSDYALAQKGIPIDIKATPDDKFLLVTMFGKTFLNVISLADERVIKQIDLTTNPDEIVVDNKTNKAYISSSDDSSIYVVNLTNMTLIQKIKAKGECEKLSLTEDGSKLFYIDKKTNEIWVIELSNNYVTKDIGSFPNVSKIMYSQGKIYVTSRISNKIAVIDYATMSLIKELETKIKPIDMILYKTDLFILAADSNTVQVLDTILDQYANIIELNTNGFSTKIYRIKGTNKAIVTDTKVGKYSIIDLASKKLIKTNSLNVPVSQIVITPTIRKINK